MKHIFLTVMSMVLTRSCIAMERDLQAQLHKEEEDAGYTISPKNPRLSPLDYDYYAPPQQKNEQEEEEHACVLPKIPPFTRKKSEEKDVKPVTQEPVQQLPIIQSAAALPETVIKPIPVQARHVYQQRGRVTQFLHDHPRFHQLLGSVETSMFAACMYETGKFLAQHCMEPSQAPCALVQEVACAYSALAQVVYFFGIIDGIKRMFTGHTPEQEISSDKKNS